MCQNINSFSWRQVSHVIMKVVVYFCFLSFLVIVRLHLSYFILFCICIPCKSYFDAYSWFSFVLFCVLLLCYPSLHLHTMQIIFWCIFMVFLRVILCFLTQILEFAFSLYLLCLFQLLHYLPITRGGHHSCFSSRCALLAGSFSGLFFLFLYLEILLLLM